MAVVIVSARHLTDSPLLTLRARPLLAAGTAALLLVVAGSIGIGYRLALSAAPDRAADAPAADSPAVDALVIRVGALTGQLARLEQQTAALALRLGSAPVTAALTSRAHRMASGGPSLPLERVADLEAGIARLDATLADLSGLAIDHELGWMAYPSRMPVAGERFPVSSNFGIRHDPFSGRLARHTGLDIPAPSGTPILASGGGRVVAAGYKGAYGRAVVIDHGDGLATLYGHASKLLVDVGDVVLPQQRIALVGSTGRSTGPHLHFEVIRHGHSVEPRDYLAQVLEQRTGDSIQ